jgi:hypothetical protein|tara:strand:- start:186 stop:626 length:441 start_codon:yes stop_codon:yes gene_type:complete
MANIIPFSFRGALLSAQHDFANGGNAFKIALYTSNPYSTSSTVYLTTNEVSSANSSNYVAAGEALGSQAVASGTAVASVDFADASWNSATFTAAFAAIYNTTTVDGTAGRLCVVLDFGGNKTATNGTFTISFPNPSTPANAIISMA